MKHTRIMLLTIGLGSAMLLSGCIGERTSVQPGEVARQLTSSGLEEKIYQPGVFRMDACFASACPKLVRLQTNRTAVDLTIDSLFLPQSNVDLTNVTVGIQFRVKPDQASINQVYRDVKPVQASTVEGNQGESGRVLIITTDMVWDTFGKRKAPDAIVTALREYTVDQVLVNVPEIAAFTKDMINEMLADTPIEVTELGFPNGIGEVPAEVRESKRRLFAIEDDKAREIKALQAALEIEDQRQAVARMRATNDLEIANELGIPVSVYQCLRAMDSFADAANTGTPLAYASGCLGTAAPAILPLPTKSQ